jgi:predicted RNA binding protein YcfA (HicA-like mRNA interferase family)
MTERLLRITASDAAKALQKAGFSCVRQSGSHKILKNREGRRVTLPYHAGKILHPKVLKSILADADLTSEEFRKLMK